MKLQHFIYLLLGIGLYSCSSEEIVGQYAIDDIPPSPVTNVSVTNTPGGAIITYDLPTDEDLLCVKAVYDRVGGEPAEAKSSLYSNTLTIEGFADTEEKTISIVAVDRSNNESTIVTTTVNPLTPPVVTVGETLKLIEDFGGVHAYWDNPERDELSIVLLGKDHNDEFVPLTTFYSTTEEGEEAYRGLDTLALEFGIYVKDRWGNQSPTLFDTLTPLFEAEMDKLLFDDLFLPGDEPDGYGWVLPNLWNGTISKNNGFHTTASGTWPQVSTFDMGQVAQLSRFVLWQRTGYLYRHGNPKVYELYGAEELDPSGDWDNWTLLAECNSFKPSGLPIGSTSSEDEEWASAGEEFVIGVDKPRVRYLRLKILETWSGGIFWHATEISLFGDAR